MKFEKAAINKLCRKNKNKQTRKTSMGARNSWYEGTKNTKFQKSAINKLCEKTKKKKKNPWAHVTCCTRSTKNMKIIMPATTELYMYTLRTGCCCRF